VLTITELTRTFPPTKKGAQSEVRAVDNVSLNIEKGELFTLLGPSGCGKTTTLRCVAGLEKPDGGEIVLADRILYSAKAGIRLDANKRGLGMVFQSYAIWPHMNVFRNVAFPLEVLPRKSRPAKAEIRKRVERALGVVQLDHLAGRAATDLSGGQQQRLALARALVMEPPLLLLDEPLSNLDAKLREGMRFELKRLQREVGITAIYVTHDQVEALAMSNRIAVMRGGKVEQIGRPREVYSEPASQFVADFIGSSNFIPGKVLKRDSPNRVYHVETSAGDLVSPSQFDLEPGDSVVVAVRPENLSLEPVESAQGPWHGVVETRAFLGEAVDHIVRIGELKLQIRVNPSISIEAGTPVKVCFAKDTFSVLPSGN
jgi:iron(III) transport system ATP-binding protein